MKRKSMDTRKLVTLALMTAIIILLANTPLGMIQLPIIKATTVHIPVILGAIILGPLCGLFLGGVFGICSMISNTMAPTLLSFAFSPFLAKDVPGVFKAIWISVGCRMMIGLVSGLVWKLLNRKTGGEFWKLPLTGFIGSMTNTVLVMGSIYILLASQYAEARQVAVDAVWGLILGTVTASGIPEAIAAAILVLAIGQALLISIRKRGGFRA